MLLGLRHWTALGLSCLLGWLQFQLWQGPGGLPQVESYRQQLADQRQANEQARLLNEQLAGEVRDLQEGKTMIEEIARFELGMIKHDEVFVQFSAGPQPATPAADKP
jgi:cell division protein FtsB